MAHYTKWGIVEALPLFIQLVEKRVQINDWEKIKIKNKKSDEQYILNKPKVLQF